MKKGSIGTIATLSLLLAIAAYYADPHPFLGELLLSLAANGVAIIIGLFFVDRIIQQRNASEWATVRRITLRRLSSNLHDLVVNFLIHVPLSDRPNHHFFKTFLLEKRPSEAAAKTIREFSEYLNEPGNRAAMSAANQQTLTDSYISWYESISGPTNDIRTVLFSRLAISFAPTRLIEKLDLFDEKMRAMQERLQLTQQVKAQQPGGATPGTTPYYELSATPPDVSALFQSIAELQAVIWDEWKKSN